MFGGLRSILPAALMFGLANSAMSAGQLLKRRVPELEPPSTGRSRRSRSRGAGISPAVAGPHSEPQIHIRSIAGVHYWFTQAQWDAAQRNGFRLAAKDLVERVDGYGAVTKRVRVDA